MSRTPASAPINLLRAALASDDPEFRALAKRKIAKALEFSKVGLAAEALGITRDGLERLRRDFASDFPAEWRLDESGRGGHHTGPRGRRVSPTTHP